MGLRHLVLFLCLVAPALAQESGVIEVGRPKLWPFAEASSLIHSSRENVANLRITSPQATDLDPNQINMRELDTLRTSFSILAEFDQGAFLKSRADLRDFNFKRQQWESKTVRNDQIKAELSALNTQKSILAAEQARFQSRKQVLDSRIQEIQKALQDPSASALTDDQRKNLQKELDSKSAEERDDAAKAPDLAAQQAFVDARISALTDERNSLGDLTAPQFPALGGGSGGSGASDPSTSSGNHTNDNSSQAPDASSNAAVQQAITQRIASIVSGDAKQTLFQVLENLTDGELQLLSRKLTLGKGSSDPYYQLYFMELSATVLPGRENQGQLARVRWKMYPCKPLPLTGAEIDRLQIEQIQATKLGMDEERTPFIYELTPIRSQLLTSGSALHQSSREIGGKAGFLGGLLHVNSNKDQSKVRQALERDVLVAGAGKGLPEFGWDIMPVSAEDSVAPGVYTAFAILAVPDSCNALEMSRNEGWLDLKTKATRGRAKAAKLNHGDSQAEFDEKNWQAFKSYEYHSNKGILLRPNTSFIDLPTLGSTPPITKVSYVPARAGGMASVTIQGPLISEETRVLVGGTPLSSRQFSGNNLSAAEKPVSSSAVATPYAGEYDVPSSKLLIMRFQCPANYTGTPSIVIYSPSFSALDIRQLSLDNQTAAARDLRHLKRSPDGSMRVSFDLLEQWYMAGASLGDVLCRAKDEDPITMQVKLSNRRVASTLVASSSAEVIDAIIEVQGISNEGMYDIPILLNPAAPEACQWVCVEGGCFKYPGAQYSYGDFSSHAVEARKEAPFSTLPLTPTGDHRFAARIRIERIPISCGVEVLMRPSPESGMRSIPAPPVRVFSTPHLSQISIPERDGDHIGVVLEGDDLRSIKAFKSDSFLGEATIEHLRSNRLVLRATLKNKSPSAKEVYVSAIFYEDDVKDPAGEKELIQTGPWKLTIPAVQTKQASSAKSKTKNVRTTVANVKVKPPGL